MTIRNVTEAKAELSALLVMVENGEEVVISRSGKPIAKLVAVSRPETPRKLGALKGKIVVSGDFDEPMPEIEEVFYGDHS